MEVAQLKARLELYRSDEMTCWPVSPRLGNVKNDEASLIEPILVVSVCSVFPSPGPPSVPRGEAAVLCSERKPPSCYPRSSYSAGAS